MPRAINTTCFISTSFLLWILSFCTLLNYSIPLLPIFQLEPTRFYMGYEIAFCFLITNIILTGIFFRLRCFAITVIVLFISFLLSLLIQYFLTINWHITQKIFFFVDFLPAYNHKLLPVACLSFIVITSALFSLITHKKVSENSIISASWVSVLVIGFGILSLFGYVIHTHLTYEDGTEILGPLSAIGSIAFICLGIAIGTITLSFGYHSRLYFQRILPVLAVVLISLVSLLFWRFALTNDLLPPINNHFSILAITKEIFMAIIFGTAIYFLQRSRYYAHHIQYLLAITESTLEATVDGILVLDQNCHLVNYNEKFANLCDLAAFSKLADQNKISLSTIFSEVVMPNLLISYIYNWQNSLEISPIIEIYFKNGNLLEVGSVPRRINNRVVGRVFSFHDITQRKKAEDQLKYHATHDALTGLANHFSLLDHVKEAIYDAKKPQCLLAIVFFDLNRFKPVNDSFGHTVGDVLLKSVAQRLLNYTRKTDILARVGGDEFVLLVKNLLSDAYLLDITKRYTDAFSIPFQINEYEFYLNCSIGVSIYPTDGDTAETLIKNADIAMYHAKKNHALFQFYTQGMDEFITKRLLMGNDLHRALQNNEFFLYYQPIVDIQKGVVSALEVLIRWHHPQQGLIPSALFISIAEEMDLIIDIGNWVINTTYKQIKSWREAGIITPTFKISVNISEKQIRQKGFYEMLANTFKDNSNNIVLELTESILTNDESIKILKKLKAIGFLIAVDDFGVKYSSLNYINHLPLDKLKIDQSFINAIATEKTSRAITLAILTMANNLGLTVLAEGVETQQQLTFLYIHACQEVQGYYFSQPVSAVQIPSLLIELNQKIPTLLAKLPKKITTDEEE